MSKINQPIPNIFKPLTMEQAVQKVEQAKALSIHTRVHAMAEAQDSFKEEEYLFEYHPRIGKVHITQVSYENIGDNTVDKWIQSMKRNYCE